MEIRDTPFVRGFIRMAHDGWEQGWHERNGGNLSYRLKPSEVDTIQQVLTTSAPGAWLPLCADEVMQFPNIAGEMFLITAAGSYFRNIELDPSAGMGLIEMDDGGQNYRVRWGFTGGGRPTSELPTHLMNQSVKKEASGGRSRVIYHAHPANINALTFVLPHDDGIFTRELWAMISECAMVFPDGVSVVEWMVPGSLAIARASSEKMQTCDVVIWVHHGMFCAGEDFDGTFGLMHTVEKAAEILVKVKSMTGSNDIVSRITDESLKDLAAAYGLTIRL